MASNLIHNKNDLDRKAKSHKAVSDISDPHMYA